MSENKKALIIGAGPAGLTAAYELIKRSGIKPIILEAGDFCGGISRTFDYKGNKMDMGGHRFFSKNDGIMNAWLNILPLGNPEEKEEVMLERKRVSRIYYGGAFFDYPVKLNMTTVRGLGFKKMLRTGFSYGKTLLTPKREEKSLEDFMINRFGAELYETFFKEYTQKLWGVKCKDIPADWGAQRIKGVSISEILKDIFKKSFGVKEKNILQKDTETSLIDRFLYPKYGPGQMWERVAREIKKAGGEIIFNAPVTEIECADGRVKSVLAGGRRFEGDYFFSSMPVKNLVSAFGGSAPDNAREAAAGLMYRNFRVAGLLYSGKNALKDTWIYVQEKNLRMGRLQVFNNWSPYLVKNPDGATWLGAEYFCSDTDDLWTMSDEDFIKLAAGELASAGLMKKENFSDGVSVRVPKAYPAYFGAYKRLPEIREFTDSLSNLFLIGRNGMHRYNNMDHSMLTAMAAVDNIINGVSSKDNIWDVNTEEEYHESK